MINEIKKELRASMNGILSARMREAGMPFKLIFGVELPRLQSIAQEFSADVELANQLWQQNIRETRLLAIMLMPAKNLARRRQNPSSHKCLPLFATFTRKRRGFECRKTSLHQVQGAGQQSKSAPQKSHSSTRSCFRRIN